MHSDADDKDTAASANLWEAYIVALRQSGGFDGGSSLADGLLMKKDADAVAVSGGINGFLRVKAAGLAELSRLLTGNPIFEAGGTIEVHELLED